jgi:AP-4 complex subunit mu-1
MIDWGIPQACAVENLRSLVHSKAVLSLPQQNESTLASFTAPGGILSIFSGSSGSSTGHNSAIEIAQKKVGEVLEFMGTNANSVLASNHAMRPVSNTIVDDFDSNKSSLNSLVNAVSAPDSRMKKRDEVFVDLVERLSAVFSVTGEVTACEVTGSLSLRSFINSTFTSSLPEIVIALNDDLVVGRSSAAKNEGRTAIDECNFKSGVVKTDSFEYDRSLRITAGSGETIAMNYRAAHIEALPFRLYPFIDEVAQNKLVMTVKIHADIPNDRKAVNMVVRIPVSKSAATVFTESTLGNVEYRQEDAAVVCNISSVQGGMEFGIRIAVTVDSNSHMSLQTVRRELGPVDISFEIPNWTATHLQIRSVNIEDHGRLLKCFKWTRSLTVSNSFVRRLS